MSFDNPEYFKPKADRKSKHPKYVQMIIPNSQNPVSLKFNKDNALEISFLPQKKYSDKMSYQDEIWIPPPAKTSRRIPGSRKSPKNNLIINIPADGTIESIGNQIFRIGSGKKQEQTVSEKNTYPSLKEDNKIPELLEQTQRMKDTFHAQEYVLGEAEELLKKHESKQKILSKYCRALKENMHDLATSIEELEKQDDVTKKGRKSDQELRVHYDTKEPNIVSSLEKRVSVENIYPNKDAKNQERQRREYSSDENLVDFDEDVHKKNLKRTCSIENISRMYLADKSLRGNLAEKNNKSETNKDKSTQKDSEESRRTELNRDKTSDRISSEKCIQTEKLMMKLSDNMRKTKSIVDSVYQEDGAVGSLQQKYITEVEKLYQEQQKLLNILNETYDKANNDAIKRSLQSFQVDNAENQDDNTRKISLTQKQSKMRIDEPLPSTSQDIPQQKTRDSLEERLELADKNRSKLQDMQKTYETRYQTEFNIQNNKGNQTEPKRASLKEKAVLSSSKESSLEERPEQPNKNHSKLKNEQISWETGYEPEVNIQNNKGNQTEPKRIYLKEKAVPSSSKENGLKDNFKDTKFDNSSMNNDYSCQTEITHVMRHKPSEKSEKYNKRVGDDSKDSDYISETKITQKLRFLPLNSKEGTKKNNNQPPIADILRNINKSINDVMPFCSYTLQGDEYLGVEEGSLDDTSYDDSQRYNERETRSISGNPSYNKQQRSFKEKSYNENNTLKKQDEMNKTSHDSDNAKSRRKSSARTEYNQNLISYTLPEDEYLDIEEGSLDDTSYEDSKSHNGRETRSSPRNPSFNKHRYQTRRESNNKIGNKQGETEIKPERRIKSDNNRQNSFIKKSHNKNDTLKKQDETNSFNNDKSKRKHSTKTDYNKYPENERTMNGTRHSSSDSFYALSEMEECDCSGECTNPNHFNEWSTFHNSQKMKDESHQKNKRMMNGTKYNSSGSFTALSEMEECDCSGECTNLNHFNEWSTFHNSQKMRDKSHQTNGYSFFNNGTPAAESTRIDYNTRDSKNYDENKKYDRSKVKTQLDSSQSSTTDSEEGCDRSDKRANSNQINESFRFHTAQKFKDKRQQQNGSNFFHDSPTPLAESTRIDFNTYDSRNDNQNKKYASKAKNRSKQNNEFTSTPNEMPITESSSAENNNLDLQSYQPAYGRGSETSLNAFLYSVPIRAMEKFPDPVIARIPKKTIQCKYQNVPPKNDSGEVSEMEKASNKINGLYKDIMSQF